MQRQNATPIFLTINSPGCMLALSLPLLDMSCDGDDASKKGLNCALEWMVLEYLKMSDLDIEV